MKNAVSSTGTLQGRNPPEHWAILNGCSERRDDWVEVGDLVHADTVEVSGDGDADVAFLAPVCAPRVSDDPVVVSRYRVYTIANGDDSMINLTAVLAAKVGEDAALVRHEVIRRGSDTCRDWAIVEQVKDLGDVVGLRIRILGKHLNA